MGTLVKIIARIVIGLLWVRFALKLFAVSAAGLAENLYYVTGFLVGPFRGVFPNAVVAGKFTIEFTTLLAIVVYALIEFVLIKLVFRRRDYHY